MEVSASAETVLKSRYLKRDLVTWEPTETPEEMCRRVANAAAEVELQYGSDADVVAHWSDEYFRLLDGQFFMPNSPTLMNAGLEGGEWAACYVLPIEDNMESIMETLVNTAFIHRLGGGTGFDFSELRPKNDKVFRTFGTASGPVSFIRMYDAVTGEIKQGGRRRGANMAVLRFDHPDIREFITCKDPENTQITNFNISVAITAEFMHMALNHDKYWLINPRNGEQVKEEDASEILDLMCQHAWLTGDPGILFIDTAEMSNPTPEIGYLAATNPCGESWLLPNEACSLASMNLSKYVNGKILDSEALRRDIRIVIRFLDNTINASSYATPEIEAMHRANRKIGLGVMGFHDMLIKMRIAYVSEEAIGMALEAMELIYTESWRMSETLGQERGPFPNIDKSIWKGTSRRNAHCTVIAPTGTISIIADCSSGIEPMFAIVVRRENVLGGEVLMDINPLFEEYLKQNIESTRADVILKYTIANGVLPPEQGVAEKQMHALFITANEVPWEHHIAIQAAFQEHTDNAVSKTINMREDITWQDIRSAYIMMWQKGCKGGTVYRHNSKTTQVLNFGAGASTYPVHDFESGHSKDTRPKVLRGETHKEPTGLGNVYVTVNSMGGHPVEAFIEMGQTGSDLATFREAIGKLVSISLQHHVPVEEISRTLLGIQGPSAVLGGAKSVPDAIGRVLQLYVLDPMSVTQEVDVCPSCHIASLFWTGRCATCKNCGYSTC